MLATVDETTLEELTEAHLELHAEITGDLLELSHEVFFAPQGEHWSPAEHVDHLTRCVEPLVKALRLPRLLLRLRFGRAGGASRPTDGLVGDYLGKLAAGARARGRYRPESPAAEERTETRQRQILTAFRRLGDSLGRALFRWKDEELDRYKLPHPLLGSLTIREILAWSLYHGRHHRRRVLERLDDGAGDVAADDPRGPAG